MVFSVLISNTDDHLRNHGFLYDGTTGWRLSPMFDVNPTPADLKARFLSTAINLVDNEASIDLVLSVAAHFALDEGEARAIAKDEARTVSEWRSVATSTGLSSAAVERMASALEHAELSKALAL